MNEKTNWLSEIEISTDTVFTRYEMKEKSNVFEMVQSNNHMVMIHIKFCFSSPLSSVIQLSWENLSSYSIAFTLYVDLITFAHVISSKVKSEGSFFSLHFILNIKWSKPFRWLSTEKVILVLSQLHYNYTGCL